MKLHAALVSVLFSCSVCIQGQSPSSAPGVKSASPAQSAPASAAAVNSAVPPKIDPVKEADIRRLLDVVNVAAVMTQSMKGADASMRPILTNSFPPGEYREKLVDLFFAKFHSKIDTKALIDLIVPIYDKYLSDEDVRGLIAFYGTPLGQKTIDTLPKIMGEAQDAGRKWGEALGRDSMMEVMAEHPDLAKAAEAAREPAFPK